jgi:hypothetical protein
MQRLKMKIFYYADNGTADHVVINVPENLLSNYGSIKEHLPGSGLIDNKRAGRVGRILPKKGTSFFQFNIQCSEKIVVHKRLRGADFVFRMFGGGHRMLVELASGDV